MAATSRKTTTKNRWYDQYPPLAKQLEKLKDLTGGSLNSIIRGLRDLILEHDPDLIDSTVMNYQLTVKRRWYDKDPLVWLTINALNFADTKLINNATRYLKKSLAELQKQNA